MVVFREGRDEIVVKQGQGRSALVWSASSAYFDSALGRLTERRQPSECFNKWAIAQAYIFDELV